MSSIETAIVKGEYDANLDAMFQAIKLRKDALSPKVWDFTVGDRVRYVASVRPKYLAGAEGTVTEIRRTKISVRLDEPRGRFRGIIVTPTDLVEKM
jgi:hypothetical protein